MTNNPLARVEQITQLLEAGHIDTYTAMRILDFNPEVCWLIGNKLIVSAKNQTVILLTLV